MFYIIIFGWPVFDIILLDGPFSFVGVSGGRGPHEPVLQREGPILGVERVWSGCPGVGDPANQHFSVKCQFSGSSCWGLVGVSGGRGPHESALQREVPIFGVELLGVGRGIRGSGTPRISTSA